MTTLRLLADDLTGALDAAAEFAPVAAPLHAFWHGGLPATLPCSAAVDSGTREMGRADARRVVAALAPALAAGGIAFKKVDSLMRGQTLAELAACVGAGWERCVFAPAFPFQGRITRGGQQHVWRDGVWQPAGPDLVAALRAEGVAAQSGQPGAALAPGVTVFDAETDADLDKVVAGADGQDALWCGTGGLARALSGQDAACTDQLPCPVLGLFGSDQETTFAQLAVCAPHWVQLAGNATHDIAARLADGLALVSIALPSGLGRDAAASRIGRALNGLAAGLQRPGTLLVAGGETLRGLCLALGASSLELQGRILPGLPRSILRGGVWEGVTVVSKSGAFGPPTLLRDLLARNGFFNGRTA